MTPGVRTEPDLNVRLVHREGRTFILEDEYYEGTVIGTRQLQADGAWSAWSGPCDVVDETRPVEIKTWIPPTTTTGGNYTQIFHSPTITGTSTNPNMITVSPGMLATITS